MIIRTLAWIGPLAIIILSVVPATDRPITGLGQVFEHLAAYGIVAGVFALECRLSLKQLLIIAFLFCSGIELLQVPLPTRHARLSDFVIDVCSSWAAICLVAVAYKLWREFRHWHQSQRHDL